MIVVFSKISSNVKVLEEITGNSEVINNIIYFSNQIK